MEEREVTNMYWEAPEFVYRHKTINWYWINIILATLFIAVAIWQHNFLFGIFIFIAEILILAWSQREPEIILFRVTDKGVHIGEHTFHPHERIASFSTDPEAEEDWAAFVLAFHNRYRPSLKIHAPKDGAEEIQKELQLYLTEIEHEDSFTDALERLLGF
jgi:hypothetical protein